MNKHTLSTSLLFPRQCSDGVSLAHSDSDGGYMDMNKEEGGQFVATKELSYADIEPAVYETSHMPAGVIHLLLLCGHVTTWYKQEVVFWWKKNRIFQAFSD